MADVARRRPAAFSGCCRGLWGGRGLPWRNVCLPQLSDYPQHNKISSVDGRLLKPLVALETLDLSNNDLTELRAHCFPAGLRIRELFLASNKIVQMEAGALDRLSSSLQVLRLNRNRLSQIPIKAFQLGHLAQLELSRNKLRMIEGLTFQGLDGLEVLKLQRNNISKLTDGAFWGLSKMRALHLDYNSLREVNSGSLYGLSSLLQLFLSNNSISHINPDGWRFCQKLRELNLSYNNLTRLDEASLAVLGDLHTLRLGHNAIGHVTEGAFRGLRTLRNLELDHNDISGTIEDTNGAFGGLDSLSKLNLGGNAIRSIQLEAFSKTRNLQTLVIQSDSFLCDCQLRWFPEWLVARGLQGGVSATCAHPESLKGASLFRAPAERFVCDDLPKPQITVHPESTISVLGKDVRLTCTAASSSSSPMTFAWRKDQELLRHAQMENFAHVSTQDGGVMQYTTILLLHQVTFSHEGRYQCVISNHFGSSYSNKARLTVNVLPSFVKMPRDITIRTGTTARLECAAKGHPTPQIAWQKDGGTDFPAARERRMHVMPDDDVFFIMDVKPEDMGTYSCTAKNTAGTVSANATLTVLETPHLAQDLEDRSVVVGETVALQCKALGSPAPRITWLRGDEPLRPGDRHHFTAGNQLLIIRSAALDDAGRYTCLMSNTLGTERAHCQLSVQRRAHACLAAPGPSTITVGIIVIAVVTSIVVTSLVWVCIIYQTRKKGEECSITNTDETIIPPDVPSYLSSQGTLSERQDVCVRVESSAGSQPNGHINSNGTVYPGEILKVLHTFLQPSMGLSALTVWRTSPPSPQSSSSRRNLKPRPSPATTTGYVLVAQKVKQMKTPPLTALLLHTSTFIFLLRFLPPTWSTTLSVPVTRHRLWVRGHTDSPVQWTRSPRRPERLTLSPPLFLCTESCYLRPGGAPRRREEGAELVRARFHASVVAVYKSLNLPKGAFIRRKMSCI
uniref:Ig-like domain-containing protein n=1 Tax=Denticeps clupeoides TaxID=299321 RepID=A0AAY4BWG0_9TELE